VSAKDAADRWVTPGGQKAIKEAERSGADTPMVRAWNEALDASPDAKAGTWHRGYGGLSEEQLTAIVDGKEIEFDASTSFSASAKEARTFAEKQSHGDDTFVLMEMVVDESSPTFKDISSLNRYGEKEAIGRVGTRVKIVHTEEVQIGERYGYKVKARLVGGPKTLGGPGSGNFGHGGRPGEIGGSGPGTEKIVSQGKGTQLHGTTRANVESILRDGITADRANAIFTADKAAMTGGAVSAKGHVYTTANKAEAQRYAEAAAWPRDEAGKALDEGLKAGAMHPAVIEVKIPASEKGRLTMDTHSDTTSSARQFKGNIKPEWIVAVHVGVVEKDNGPMIWRPVDPKTFRGSEESLVYYVPWVLDEDKPTTLGGKGSGNFDHAGRPGEVGGSGGAGGTSEKIGTPATRTARALATHKPSTKEKQALADKSEHEIAEVIGGTRTDDNDPFDTVVKTPGHMHGVEVKTLIDNTNDKITMHPDARERKIAWGRRNHAAMHTVVVDMRTSQTQYYYRRGVGSFRVSAMKAVSRSELSGLIRK
jgi:hypothetical protein